MWVTGYSNNWKCYHSNLWVPFPMCEIAFHSNYVLYHFWDKARYWSKIAIFSYPLHSTLPLGGLRRNIAIIVECGTTRMVWRPDDDKTVIRLAVLTQYRRVTDGRTDIVWWTDRRASCVTDGQTGIVRRTDRRTSRVTDGQTDIVCDKRTSCVTDGQTDIVWRTDSRTSCDSVVRTMHCIAR